MSGLMSVSYFLISMLFGFVTFILWVKFGLQYFRISALHPISQSISRLSDPVLIPIAKIIQVQPSRHRRYDWVCLGALVVVIWLKYAMISALYFGHASLWSLTAVYTLADLIIQPCDILFYALVIRVVMSWVNPQWQNPLAAILFQITEPMLQRIRQYIPYIAGFDFSSFFLMIILKVITLFVSASLPFHLL